jgi:hypothetical protein
MRKYILVSLGLSFLTFIIVLYLVSPSTFSQLFSRLNPLSFVRWYYYTYGSGRQGLENQSQNMATDYNQNSGVYDYQAPNLAQDFSEPSSSTGFFDSLLKRLGIISTLPEDRSLLLYSNPKSTNPDAGLRLSLAKNSVINEINNTSIKVPSDWQVSKDGNNVEITTPLGNKVFINNYSLSKLNSSNFDFTTNNVTKDLINNIFKVDTYTKYNSVVNNDSKMYFYRLLQNNGSNKIYVWFKELSSTEEVISLNNLNPVNTVIFINGDTLCILNSRFSSDIRDMQNFNELQYLENLIESFEIK